MISAKDKARKLRYRTDAEYRELLCKRSRDCRAKWKKDPLFRKLENARKAVYRVRESYHARLAHAERLFEQLTKLIAEREQLAEQWKARHEDGRKRGGKAVRSGGQGVAGSGGVQPADVLRTQMLGSQDSGEGSSVPGRQRAGGFLCEVVEPGRAEVEREGAAG